MTEPTREELLAEAYQRGLLPPDIKAAYEEAQSRGILSKPGGEQPQPVSRQTSTLPPLNMMPSHSPELAQAHGPQENAFNKLAGVRESLLGPNSGVSAEAVAPYARMTLEGGGATLGTLAGLPGGPVGGAIGGGLGYAGGKAIADVLEESTGIRRKRTDLDQYLDPVGGLMHEGGTAEIVTRPIRDAALGTALAGPAELISKGVVATLSGGKIAFQRVTGAIEKQAAKRLAAYTSEGPVYAKNAEEALEIERMINAGAKEGDPVFQFNLGQRSGDPNQLKLEIGAALPKGKGAELKDAKAMQNAEALRRYHQRNFGGEEGVEDVLGAATIKKETIEGTLADKQKQAQNVASSIATETPEQTGATALSKIEEAQGPVKATMNELEAAIPDYPMKLTNLETEIELALKDPKLSLAQRKAVEQFAAELPQLTEGGATTFKAMGISRTLNDKASAAYMAGDDSIGAIMTRLKNDGLKNDLQAISDMARTGKVGEYKGQFVDADKLADELERGLTSLADMKSRSKPDLDAIKKGIQDAGGRVPMRVVQESEASFAERISKDYKNLTGQEPPTKGAYSEQIVKNLETRNNEIKQILSEFSPGQDVAAHMSAYNKYASQEYFGRFGKGAVDQVTAKGNQYAGTKIRIEDIPSRFKTATGADDLIRAIGADQAKDVMRGNIAYDMMEKVIDKSTGEIRTKALDSWLSSNKLILEKYGLQEEFTGLQNAQNMVESAKEAAKEFEKTVAAKMIGYKVSGQGYQIDPKSAISVIMEGKRTSAQMTELVQMINGDKTALKGLKNSYGDWITDQAYLTWKGAAENPTVSMDKFVRTMQKAREGARVLYADEPEKLRALETMQRAYEISARSSRSPGGVGSDTAEKVLTSLGNQASNIAASGSSIYRYGKAFYNFIAKIGKSKTDELVARAVFDPDYAYNLMRGVKGQIAPERIESILGNKVILLDDYKKNRMRAILTGEQAAGQSNE